MLTFSSIPAKSEWPVSRASGDGARTVKGRHRSPDSEAQQQVATSASQIPQPVVLHQLLSVLAGDAAGGWHRFDTIHGIEWCENAPQPFSDAGSSRFGYCRTGRLTLPGFGQVELPARDPDGGYATRIGNEGECSLTLYGDAETVHELVLVKYYPYDNASDVVAKSLQGPLDVQPQEVVGDDPAQRLYQIQFPYGGMAYAAITNEEGGRCGPGFTIFVLTKTDPRARGD